MLWVLVIVIIIPSDDDAARRLAFLCFRDDRRRAELGLGLEARRGLEQLVDELRARRRRLVPVRLGS